MVTAAPNARSLVRNHPREALRTAGAVMPPVLAPVPVVVIAATPLAATPGSDSMLVPPALPDAPTGAPS